MATESPIRILEGTDRWRTVKQPTRYGPSSAKMAIEGLGLFLKDQRCQIPEKDVIPSRSESAPPSMEGSIAAMENIFPNRKSALNPVSIYPNIAGVNHESEVQFRADPSSSYHDTDANLDRRFTWPRGSMEGHHIFQPIGSTGSGPRNSLPAHEEESEDDQSSEKSTSVPVEKAGLLGYHSRSLDSTQDHTSSPSYDQYSSVSISSGGTNAPFSVDTKPISSLDSTMGILVRPPVHERDFNAVKVDPQDNLSTAGSGDADRAHIQVVKSVNVFSASNSDSHKLHKKEQLIPQNNMLHQQAAPQECSTSRVQDSYAQIIYPGISHAYGGLNQFNYNSSSVSMAEIQPTLQSSGFTPPLYATAAAYMTPPSQFYHNPPPAGFFTLPYGMGGYNLNSAVLPSYLTGYPHQGAVPLAFDGASFPTPGVSNAGSVHAYDLQNLLKFYGRVGVPLQSPFHMQYFQPSLRDPYGSYSHFDHQSPRDGAFVNQVNSYDSKKGSELIGLSKPQHLAGAGYNNLNLKSGNVSSHYYFGSPTNVSSLRQFPTASVVSPVVQSKPASDTNFPGGRYNMSLSHSSSGTASKTNGQSQTWNAMNSHYFLEELKSGKGQRLELVDQHGSRFIQQKLETCSVEEKASVFKEVVPHASKLITDVFGNYVVQKLFEFGTPEQRMYLANQLEGQILPLSFQMYGCRVIQKALDVIDLEQKARLVRELDGHIMRCVRDQNGNHVIQKCIESIPTEKIHFIISSFRGQVATLSMHPYGCRVIQRFLEHCNDDVHTQFIVDEILDSVCSLAQDQYGNYVTQHVLERGKPHERSQIIEKLAGSIVQLSQHKFASNVVEKCLEYSDSTARGVLIKEIIGDDDKNDNLLIMMKDQYANYVIQKILEKCSNDHRELLLGQIRNHLTALKKYTYGKHIAARFEQLYGDG
ncbi:hypothetical protein DH2020_034560 [Rehmannia glutinosa]|uniref:PUM-HD domain-containing protein n=1 Tax=Rehmannia glutinosa TaxID=99300 RepID=A0ABR0V8X9_REHGL